VPRSRKSIVFKQGGKRSASATENLRKAQVLLDLTQAALRRALIC
jgi:hypothetical protein